MRTPLSLGQAALDLLKCVRASPGAGRVLCLDRSFDNTEGKVLSLLST